MASFFTVNVALHFLFNWKIEKSKYSPIRVSSEYSRKSSVFGGIVTRASYFNRRSSTSIAPDVGGNAPRRSTLQRAPSAQGMEGSLHGGGNAPRKSSLRNVHLLHVVDPSPRTHHIGLNCSNKEDALHQHQTMARQSSFQKGDFAKNSVMQANGILLVKAASDNNLTLHSSTNLHPKAVQSYEDSNLSRAGMYKMRSESYEEKDADEIIDPVNPERSCNDHRKLRKYGSTRSLVSLPENQPVTAYDD